MRSKKTIFCILAAVLMMLTAGCSSKNQVMDGDGMVSSVTDDASTNAASEEMTMKLIIGKTEVPVVWEDNESVAELKSLLPLTIQMSMYGGFEQAGAIGQSIVRDDQQITTEAGDIALYSGNQIVIFYGSNSWAYTRLGHIDLDQKKMAELLGSGDVTITISEE